ncbi:MAG: leucine-rich repeat domain-containing protein [Roseburia sp.]|nr:leucine-rich repeat domain-containing protein [Roseburia sp.]
MLNYDFYWEPAADGGVRLLRVFGMMPEVELPAEIEGRQVTEIGAYCFAERPHLPEHYEKTRTNKGKPFSAEPREICGSYLERVILPDPVKKIGNLAFYNCNALTTLELSSGMTNVGSDAFMNCRNLHAITLRCGAREKSGIRQILAQISSDMEVTFQGKNGVEAVLLFPDYYEGFDEITPAHIFGRKIEGEGFRARESFKNGIPDFAQYDQIFPKACVEESVGTLCRLAMNRLRYPIDLGSAVRLAYEKYIKAHADEICGDAIKKRDMEQMEFLCENHLLEQDILENGVQYAAKAGWAEGAANFLRLKEQYFPMKGQADRYSFEDF